MSTDNYRTAAVPKPCQKKIFWQVGFTLMEVLLSLAILAVITLISMPVYQSFQTKNDLDIATTTLVQSLRRAQLLSQAMDGDSSWGVYVQSGSITVFQGSSYAGRNSSFDEVFYLPTVITINGLSEVLFSKIYGEPQTVGTTTLTTISGQSKNIAINSKGRINF